MDEACFVLEDVMTEMTFRELTDELVRLYNQHDYVGALALVDGKVDLFPENVARTTFWRMCLLGLCNRPDDVISVFQQGLDNGLWWGEDQFRDSDLDAVRDLPEFKVLVQASNEKCIDAQAQIGHDRAVLVPDDVAGELPLLIFLHGRSGDKNYNLEYWDVARQRGWLVLSPQSRQAIFPGAYCWDKTEQGLQDVLFHLEEIVKMYKVDPKRVVMAGFSQGSGLAIYAALSGKVGARGFIGVGTFLAKPDSLIPLASQSQSMRGYFVTGEKDHTLDKAKAIQNILKDNNIQFGEEVHPDLGHAFPSDFEKSFDKAIDFIFKEQE
jgi:predicted esterase